MFIYLIASIIIIVINLVPAFMPPTWTIISFFYIRYEINLLALSLIGAFSSSIGRYILAEMSGGVTPKIFSNQTIDNINFIGEKIKGSPLKVFLITFIWAISPIASNPLFIAIGLARTKIKYVLGGFFLGRSISYFFLALGSKIVVITFEDIFYGSILDIKKVILNVFAFLLIFVYLVIDWKALLVERKFRFIWVILKRKK